MKRTSFTSCITWTNYFWVFVVLITPNIFGQGNFSESQIDLIERCLIKNYNLKNAKYELAIDSIEQKGIRQNYIPTLSMNGFYSYVYGDLNIDVPAFQLPLLGVDLFDGNSEFKAQGNVMNTNLTAKALLFSGMQVSYGSKASLEKIKAKNYLLDEEESKIIIDVIDTYDKIELLNKSKIVLQESEIRLAKEKEKVIIAIKNGLATPYDREKIKAAELKIASKKMEINGSLSLLYLKLSMDSGVDQETLETIDFDLSPWVVQNNDQTYQNRPELKALDASIKAYDYKLKMNKSLFLPKLEAFATLSYFNLFGGEIDTPYNLPVSEEQINLDLNYLSSFPTYFVGLGFEWEIFSGYKHSNEIQKTTIQKNMANNQKEDAREKLELNEKKARIDFDLKNQQIKLKQQEKEVAENTLHFAIKSFQQGLIDSTERLQAELNYQEIVFDYYKAIAEQRKSALELLDATGSLTLAQLKNL